jgi:hypothetical protein
MGIVGAILQRKADLAERAARAATGILFLARATNTEESSASYITTDQA